MSGGTADRGDLSVLTKEIPTGSGLHKLLPSLKNAGKCVNVIPLKDSQEAEVSQSKYVNDAVLLWNITEIFQPAAGPVLRRLCVFYVSCWQIEQVELGNFGTQAVLSIKTYSGYTNVDVVSPRETKQGCHTFIYLECPSVKGISWLCFFLVGAVQVADAQVNGLTVSKQTFQANETSTGVITDMTGCRHSGQ